MTGQLYQFTSPGFDSSWFVSSAISEWESSVRSAILLACADCCLRCDWLQQCHTPQEIRPILSFPLGAYGCGTAKQHCMGWLRKSHTGQFHKSWSLCWCICMACVVSNVWPDLRLGVCPWIPHRKNWLFTYGLVNAQCSSVILFYILKWLNFFLFFSFFLLLLWQILVGPRWWTASKFFHPHIQFFPIGDGKFFSYQNHC